MSKLKIIAWLSAALLAGCGGGNTLTGTAVTGGTGTTSVATVTVTPSAAQIAADGSDSSTITAVAKDANNNFVAGATVTFTSTAGWFGGHAGSHRCQWRRFGDAVRGNGYFGYGNHGHSLNGRGLRNCRGQRRQYAADADIGD